MNETTTVRDAAKLLGVSTRTVRRYIKAGHLEATRKPIGHIGAYELQINIASVERLQGDNNEHQRNDEQ